jgi:hypothetical protein
MVAAEYEHTEAFRGRKLHGCRPPRREVPRLRHGQVKIVDSWLGDVSTSGLIGNSSSMTSASLRS